MLQAVFNGNIYDVISIRLSGYNRYTFELHKIDAFVNFSLTIKGKAKIKRHKIYIVEA